MTIVVGITGGIGSGKSTLSNSLKKKGYLVHESDAVVSNMYKNPNKIFLNLLISSDLGNAIKNKKIDKQLVAKIIFNNKIFRNKIEKYIHKEVSLQRKFFIEKNLKSKKKVIFIDVPLLLEKKLEKQFDLVVSIISTKKNRTKRVLKNKKFSKRTLNKIFTLQTSDKERRMRSNIIIYNNNTKKDFLRRADQVLIRGLK